MHYVLLTTWLLLPPSLAVVDCFAACTRCQQGQQHPALMEVYCAMCQECNARRREQMMRESVRRQDDNIVYNLEDPEECPTAPPCQSDIEEDLPPGTLPSKKLTKPVFSSTTTTTTTTTHRPCPPITECMKRKTHPPRAFHPTPQIPCYIPCMPMCPCPYPQFPNSQHKLVESTAPKPSRSPPHELAELTPTRKSSGYMYVYVGVPKKVLQQIKQ